MTQQNEMFDSIQFAEAYFPLLLWLSEADVVRCCVKGN